MASNEIWMKIMILGNSAHLQFHADGFIFLQDQKLSQGAEQ
jgi:hypothetical protein